MHFACVLHEFGMSLARVWHEFCTQACMCSEQHKHFVTGAVKSCHRSGPISPARRAFVTMMSCACYSATAGRGEWHEVGMSLARVLHEFGTSFARTARAFCEFCMSLARILHEFCTSFSCFLHAFFTIFSPVSYIHMTLPTQAYLLISCVA